MESPPVLRVARPTDRLGSVAAMYRDGLGYGILGRFEDHQGFDGVILGHPGLAYHLELTSKRGHGAGRAPTEDPLLVFYLPHRQEWEHRCARMAAAGFRRVAAFNPGAPERPLARVRAESGALRPPRRGGGWRRASRSGSTSCRGR